MANRLVKVLEGGRFLTRGCNDMGSHVLLRVDPDEVLVFTVDWTPWLGGNTIQSVSNQAEGVTITSNYSGSIVTLKISGSPGFIQHRISDSAGQTKEVRLEVRTPEGQTFGAYGFTSSHGGFSGGGSFDLQPGQVAGYADYNHGGAAIALVPNVWTTIPNNGAGAFTNKSHMPDGVQELLDASAGAIDPRQLSLGDLVYVRNDFQVTPQANNAALDFRYTLGAGASSYVLEGQLGRLDRGAGISYRFSRTVDLIYMGDENTRGNLIGLQARCTGAATLVNAGSVISVVKHGG
ncbi:MAG: hypothetical protein MJH10_10345 [Epibacterium sp.]|nr:hypothetical protein [Epibacterium sp.]NQX73939.1 hypothetical protein [Epibacterium sp.]